MTDLNLFRNRWASGICIVSLSSVIISTLAPFNFSFEQRITPSEILDHFRHYSSLDDWIVNILLYVPVGFSFSAWLQSQKVNRSIQFFCVLLFAFGLSTTVETLQVFLPSRVPSLTDIYANTIGGIVGLQCFSCWEYSALFDELVSMQMLIRRRIASLPIQNLTLIFVAYVLSIFFLTVGLQSNVNFSNWTPIYSLIIGNGGATRSPWSGYIATLAIANKAASAKEITQTFAEGNLPNDANSTIVSYTLASYLNVYYDKTGRSPKLVWRGERNETQIAGGSLVNSKQWLETESPASFVNQRLSETSQFTLSLVLATDDVEQSESGPIVSLSNQAGDRRNLAFAQDGSSLVFWLRTPVTGESGTSPEIIIPNVFKDTEFHHLIITYDRSILRFYIDRPDNQISFEFNPGVVLFQKLLPLESLKNSGLIVCRTLYHVLFFVPLGIFAGTILIFTKRGAAYRIVLLTEGMFMVPLLLELLLVLKYGRGFNLISLLLSIAITLGSIIMTSTLNHPSLIAKNS
jgi:VanZ family protein